MEKQTATTHPACTDSSCPCPPFIRNNQPCHPAAATTPPTCSSGCPVDMPPCTTHCQRYGGYRGPVTAAELVEDLQHHQRSTARMVGVIGHGAVGRQVVHYLQQRGVAAVALLGTPPAHLSVEELPAAAVATLAEALPQGKQPNKVATAAAGIAAGATSYGATMRTHPAQLAADAKQARKREAKRLQQQRSLQGQPYHNPYQACQQLSPRPAHSAAVVEAMAEAGLVVPVANVTTV